MIYNVYLDKIFLTLLKEWHITEWWGSVWVDQQYAKDHLVMWKTLMLPVKMFTFIKGVKEIKNGDDIHRFW